MASKNEFDIIVVGAGHAGCESALICSKFDQRIALVSMDYEKIADMPCNPSIGGLAKGHLVREIDALGGEMAKAADMTAIQFRMLNMSKGPAVWGPRVQTDKTEYSKYFQKRIANDNNIQFIQSTVNELIIDDEKVKGIVLSDGKKIFSKKVIITAGTFLAGKLFCGMHAENGGRYGERASTELAVSLRKLHLDMGRLKTGTPARIYADSIDHEKTEIQKSDDMEYGFSYWHNVKTKNIAQCHITYTNERTHKIIRNGIEFSPLFRGVIKGMGPRYCPSIEDKVFRFADRKRHQVFLEPEGIKSDLVYPNGISTSLPQDVQKEFIRTIPGLEKAKISRFGYAVEYDFVNPYQLGKNLEYKKISGLYFAGQVIGTSGYEEAAALGLMAGINASLSIFEKPSFILSRENSYIGVLIDDLVTKGVNEPYRLFTSQAEHRLFLRQDNADIRLSEYAMEMGIFSKKEIKTFKERVEMRKELSEIFRKEKIGSGNTECKIDKAIKKDLLGTFKILEKKYSGYEREVIFSLANDIKYEGYISRDRGNISNEKRLKVKIPEAIDYSEIASLKNEAKEKLKKYMPETVSDALKIPGVSFSDAMAILVHLKNKR